MEQDSEVFDIADVQIRIERKEQFKYTHTNGIVLKGTATGGRDKAYTLYTKSGFVFEAVGTYPLHETKPYIQGVYTHGRWYITSVFDQLLRSSLRQLKPGMGDYAILDTPALEHIVNHGLINYLGRNLK